MDNNKSRLDRLRAGRPVEFGKGLYGQLNLRDKKIQFSDGLTVDVGDNPDYFPQNQEDLQHSQRKEKIQRGIGKNPLGEFGHQISERGLPKAAKDWYQFATLGDEYEKNLRARREVSERIAEESPYTSMAATGTSFGLDLLATRGLGAAAAGAALPALHAGPRILSEPKEVAKESLIGLGAGYLLDKGAKGLGNVAARRGAAREIKREAAEIPAINAAGKEARALEVQASKEKAISAQNAYKTAKFEREKTIFERRQLRDEAKANKSNDQARLNKEYENDVSAWKQEEKALKEQEALANKQYQEALKNQPKLEREAREAYGQEVVKAAENIEKSFHAESKVYPSQFSVDEFLDKSIREGALAGRSAEKSAEKIIKGLFPEGQAFKGKDLSRKYRVLEKAITSSPPEVAELLNQFKGHLGERLPFVLADNLAYRAVLPSFRNKIASEIKGAINQFKLPKGATIDKEKLINTATNNLDLAMASITPENFIQRMRSGEMQDLLKTSLLKESDILSDYLKLGNLKKIKSQGLEPILKKQFAYDERIQQFQQIVQNLEGRIENQVAQTELKLVKALEDSQKKLSGKIGPTLGMAAPLEAPTPPIAPELRAAPVRQESAIPVPEVVEPSPIAPPQAQVPIPAFTPKVAPTLPPAQGMAENLGDVLEKPIFGGGKRNTLGKLAGIASAKYLLGGAALPAEAAYLGLKGLTSPTAAGEAARASFKNLGVLAIIQLAERYPSYHDGILDDPRERRSLTKQIEEDPEISLEEKALLQSDVNRGKSLEKSLAR